jgi:RNA-directed DNA polymerase
MAFWCAVGRRGERSVPTHDNVQFSLLLEKVARRVRDDAVMHLLKMILKATGKKGVPQGGVISPLLSNLYLNEVDRMLEKAAHTTRRGKSTNVQYARFADDMVILIDAERRSDWLVKAVDRRLREEFAKLHVAINEDKSRMVDLRKEVGSTFGTPRQSSTQPASVELFRVLSPLGRKTRISWK